MVELTEVIALVSAPREEKEEEVAPDLANIELSVEKGSKEGAEEVAAAAPEK
jgi:hypothetical protein